MRWKTTKNGNFRDLNSFGRHTFAQYRGGDVLFFESLTFESGDTGRIAIFFSSVYWWCEYIYTCFVSIYRFIVIFAMRRDHLARRREEILISSNSKIFTKHLYRIIDRTLRSLYVCGIKVSIDVCNTSYNRNHGGYMEFLLEIWI